MIERYGYYVAHTKNQYGDPESSRLARLIWRRYGHRVPTKIDGASVWISNGVYFVTIVGDHLLDPLPNPVPYRLL